jgi:site-specific DNA-methyltransferase (adenine-specific)
MILEFGLDKNIGHPTQKPVALLEYLIKTYTNEGETVLDNTMGSGSTGVACIRTKRKFIGIELNDEYFGIAQKRISQEQQQLSLF